MTSRADVISIYKTLVRTINGISKETQRSQYMKKMKKEFRIHSKETDPSKIEELYKYANSKLDYLRVLSTYRPEAKIESQRFVYRDGEVVEGTSSVRDRRHYRDNTKVDPDDLARHQRLVRRQHFQDRHLPLRWGEDR